MGNFLINQKIKKIKEIKDFDSFDYLINWDGVHTSYLNQGQRSTDKDLWKLIIMYTNGYNSFSCFGWTLRSKIRRKSKNQRKSKNLILLIIWLPESQLGEQTVRGVKQWVDGVDIASEVSQ